YKLARQQQLPVLPAIFAAVVATFGGWTLQVAARSWITALTSFSFLPWAWWAFRHDRPRTGFLVGTFSVAAILSAGYPYTALFLAVVSLWNLIFLWRENGWKAAVPLCVSVGCGALLAAPAILTFVAYYLENPRVGWEWQIESRKWRVPFQAFFNFFVPTRMTLWRAFDGPI